MSQAASSYRALASLAKEPYEAEYDKWIATILDTNPAILSVYRYQPEVSNHVTLFVADEANRGNAQALARHWYDAFRSWRRDHPGDGFELDLHHSPDQCTVEIEDESGNLLAWANQEGVR